MPDPHIAAFMEIYAHLSLLKDRQAREVADGLRQIGATPDDVRRIAKTKALEGRTDYRFSYVLQDLAGERAVKTVAEAELKAEIDVNAPPPGGWYVLTDEDLAEAQALFASAVEAVGYASRVF